MSKKNAKIRNVQKTTSCLYKLYQPFLHYANTILKHYAITDFLLVSS